MKVSIVSLYALPPYLYNYNMMFSHQKLSKNVFQSCILTKKSTDQTMLMHRLVWAFVVLVFHHQDEISLEAENECYNKEVISYNLCENPNINSLGLSSHMSHLLIIVLLIFCLDNSICLLHLCKYF